MTIKKRPVNTSADPFKKKRNVHVSMEHNVYAGMRKRLFETGLSFPECMQEFARLIGEKDALAEQLIGRMHKNKLKRQLDDLRSTDQKVSFDVLDSDALYNIIEDEQNPSTEEKSRDE